MSTLALVKAQLSGLDAVSKRRLARSLWHRAARPAQQIPAGEWRVWYLQGGRGSGKTRAAAEALAELIEMSPPGEWAVVAPTYGDARDVCIEGPSGLLQALGLGRSYQGWNRSLGEVRLPDGGVVFVDGADDGALRLQGKNLRGAWCDEVGLWARRNWQLAWHESLGFAVRLAPARVIASGTPKQGHPLVALLIGDEQVPKSRLRTADNVANLDAAALAAFEHAYGGSRLGRQELEGEWLTDVPGALWQRPTIDQHRADSAPPLARIVVAVDPSGGDGDTHDEQGIVVCGVDHDGHGFVLADMTVRDTPARWGARVVDAFVEYEADAVVWEANFGGQMVLHTCRMAARDRGLDDAVVFRQVHASRGKRVRAEPVAALYEQGRVHHVGVGLEVLEDQLVSWTPDSVSSPDRLDALVWALSDLMLGDVRRGLRFRGAA